MPPLPTVLVCTEMAAGSVAVPRYRRPAYSRLASPAASDSAYSWPISALERSTTSKPGEGVAPGATIGISRCPRLLCPRRTAMPPSRVPSATWRVSASLLATRRTETFGGNWLACTAARTRAGVVPETPMGTGPVDALPAKAKPRMAAMARGATSTVSTAERSRMRRRNSLAVMVQISGGPPDPGAPTASRQRSPTIRRKAVPILGTCPASRSGSPRPRNGCAGPGNPVTTPTGITAMRSSPSSRPRVSGRSNWAAARVGSRATSPSAAIG